MNPTHIFRIALFISTAIFMMEACKKTALPSTTIAASVTKIDSPKSNSSRPPISPNTDFTISFTKKMGGIRNWHRHYGEYNASVDTFYYYSDTSFALTIIDVNTVSYFGFPYKYEGSDSARGIYYFGTAREFYTYSMGGGIAYFYKNDSITIVSGDKSAIHNYLNESIYCTY